MKQNEVSEDFLYVWWDLFVCVFLVLPVYFIFFFHKYISIFYCVFTSGANHFLVGILHTLAGPGPPWLPTVHGVAAAPSFSLLVLWLVVGHEESPVASPA